jgi:Domain of unknown function (DUF4386)
VDTTRIKARLIGILYIIGTLSGIFSLVFSTPLRKSPDLLAQVTANEGRLVLASLFLLVMGLALALIPVIAFPVLRKHNEPLALGYIVFRGGLETAIYLAMTVSWLMLLPLGRAIQAGAAGITSLKALGDMLYKSSELNSICAIVFCLGALMFYYVLYRSRLVPRWLSGWGLLGILLSLLGGLLVMFGWIDPDSTQVFFELTLALQEMVLAVWLIVKGFNCASNEARLLIQPA